MKTSEERFRLVGRLIELRNAERENGMLTFPEQIEHDRILGRMTYLSEKDNQRVLKIFKRISNSKQLRGVYEQ